MDPMFAIKIEMVPSCEDKIQSNGEVQPKLHIAESLLNENHCARSICSKYLK